MRYTKEQISKKFDTLPQKIKDAIFSTELEEKIKNITKKQGLHVDVAGTLNEEVVYVLVGLEPAAKFRENLAAHEGFPKEKLDAVVSAANSSIFSLVRESLGAPPLHSSTSPEKPRDTQVLQTEKSPIQQDTSLPILNRSALKSEREKLDEKGDVFERKELAPTKSTPRKITEEKLLNSTQQKPEQVIIKTNNNEEPRYQKDPYLERVDSKDLER